MGLFDMIVYFQIHNKVIGTNARIEPYDLGYKIYKRIPQLSRWWRPGIVLHNKDDALQAFIALELNNIVTQEDLIRCNMNRQDWFPIKEDPPQTFTVIEQIAIDILNKDPMAVDFATDILELKS